MSIRVLLVDDHLLFREGLRTLLSVRPGIDVIGEAGDGEEAVQKAQSLRPDVILMDLRMPRTGGVEATRAISTEMPATRIIVLTTFEEDEEIFAAVRAGACGYLLKDVSSETIVDAILSAARGESVLQPSVAAKLMNEFVRISPTPPGRLIEPLTERELEVLRLLSEGQSNKEIGLSLNLAEGTVKNHMTNILGKLGVSDRTQAALRARDLNLLDR